MAKLYKKEITFGKLTYINSRSSPKLAAVPQPYRYRVKMQKIVAREPRVAIFYILLHPDCYY